MIFQRLLQYLDGKRILKSIYETEIERGLEVGRYVFLNQLTSKFGFIEYSIFLRKKKKPLAWQQLCKVLYKTKPEI